MGNTWMANYENNEIKIQNTWFSGESLFVNGMLQDKKFGAISSNLQGHIINRKNERENIKVHLSGSFKISCYLFINDKLIEVNKVK